MSSNYEQARDLLAHHMRDVAAKHHVPGLDRDAYVIESGEEWDFWMDASHNAVTAALYAAPRGFRIVPVDPTEAMIEAGWDSASDYVGEHRRIDSLGNAWSAMLAAAPSVVPETKTEKQHHRPGRTLYVDLDGVMADFDAAFPAVFGLDHRSLADEEMWGHINSHASFFRDLPPMPGAIEFFRSVEHLQPVILTACPKSNYAHVAAQKRAWVRAHLSQTCLVLPVMGGRHKPLFMHQAGDVLIDDFGKNCAAWNEAGGIAIKHEGDWSATRAALDMISNGGEPNG